MSSNRWSALLLVVLLFLLVSCGSGVVTPTPKVAAPTPSPAPTAMPRASLKVLEATFARSLSADMRPVDASDTFFPEEAVHLSLRLAGLADTGLLVARFYWHDNLISEGTMDLTRDMGKAFFVVGEEAFAGFSLVPDQPFPASDAYRADLYYGNESLGSYPFAVVSPPDAIPAHVQQIALALDVDESYKPVDPTTTFGLEEVVYLVGVGDMGTGSWLQADWYVNSELDPTGTRTLTFEENSPAVGFAFSFLPEGGWPLGEHWVTLTLNDQQIGQFSFSATAEGRPEPVSEGLLDEDAFWEAFPLPEDAEGVPVTEGYDGGFITAMIEPELFDAYSGWLEQEGWQQQAPTEAMVTLPHQTWRKDGAELLIEIQGLDDDGLTVVWLRLEVERP